VEYDVGRDTSSQRVHDFDLFGSGNSRSSRVSIPKIVAIGNVSFLALSVARYCNCSLSHASIDCGVIPRRSQA
jgi:hypothetical protein